MKKYLSLYKKWIDTGKSGFLCPTFQPFGIESMDPLFALFIPTDEEMIEHSSDGFEGFGPASAWGSYEVESDGRRFNDFRQNIVLLMAAMNGEL
jgi:hypothetical protein